MFEFLKKYEGGSFYFTLGDDLRIQCKENVSVDVCCGVYIVYGYDGEKEEVVYIGSSGHVDEDNKLIPRKGGLRRRIYGRQNSKSGEPLFRNILWPQLMGNSINKLKIVWYNTEGDNPLLVEYCLILQFLIQYHKFPLWNNELKISSRSKESLDSFISDNVVEFL